ncbi:MAG: hypothetical protein RLZZ292_3621 [Bacteroidota bacterium]|jgi:5-methylcytosine-specific restriction endonuclease McrA
MRKIDKNPEPQSFKQWKIDHDAVLQQKYKENSGKEIWDFLQDDEAFKSIKIELEDALLAEQGSICCYCGRKVERGKMAVEHFKPKSIFKTDTYEYTNLMVSCKCSKEAFFSFKKPGFEHLDTIEKIAAHLQIELEILETMNKGMNFQKLGKGDKIYYPNPLHCDDQKSGKDITEPKFEIINPSTNSDCSDKFKYESGGKINMIGVKAAIEKNILSDVLNLNAEPLCLERAKVYKNAQGLAALIQKENKGFQEIINAIALYDRANSKNQRKEYCFVITYVLRTQLLKSV